MYGNIHGHIRSVISDLERFCFIFHGFALSARFFFSAVFVAFLLVLPSLNLLNISAKLPGQLLVSSQSRALSRFPVAVDLGRGEKRLVSIEEVP